MPSRAEWDATVSELIASECGQCHGDTPMFGAPFTLLDYSSLIDGPEGVRIVDRMAQRVSEGSMPPAFAPLPTLTERDAIASWASCGAVRVDSPVGLDVNRPPFVSPDEPPDGLRTIDLLADNFPVGPTLRDHYEDKDFTMLVEEDVFIRRIEAVIDEGRVVHHLTLRRGDPSDDAGMKYLYAWGPGTGAFQFPDGGIRLSRGDVLRVQTHYNNGAAVPDVTDSSGVRLYVGPIEGKEYVMSDPGPGAFGFRIPARSDEMVENTCTVREPVHVIASLPHMHQIGRSFELDVTRAGQTSNVLALGAWNFETQLFYELPLDLEIGDQLTIRCHYSNPTGSSVNAGTGTSDEMCFAFTYVTPARPDFCTPSEVSHIDYRPGECIREPLEPDVIVPTATMTAPSLDAIDTMPTGHFPVGRVVLVTSAPALLGAATIRVAGQMRHEGDRIEVDGAVHIVAPIDPLRSGLQLDMTFAGTLADDGTLAVDCGQLPAGGSIGVAEGKPVFVFPFGGGPVDVTAYIFFQ